MMKNFRWTATLLFFFASIALRPTHSFADRIDDELLNQMPALIDSCAERGYKNVGVLTFLCQRGSAPSQFRGAAICSNMPQRVENAMVLKLRSNAPKLILLPSASEVVARELPGATYRTAADRRRLMDIRLAPAWGSQDKVRPDAYIIGKVQTSADLRTATVSLGAFDGESTFDILEFSVPTDRFILADVGQGFSLTKGRVRGITDDAIFASIETDKSQPEATSVTNSSGSSSDQFPVELTVYYNNKPQQMTTDSDSSGSANRALPEPKAGETLTFGLKNLTDNDLAVVLLVNGLSTLYEQEGNPQDLNKWVMQPGKEYRVKGYHQEGNQDYFEITTLTEAASRDNFDDLGGQQFAGLIHLYVFQSIPAELAETPKYTRSIGRLSRSPRQPTQPFVSLPEMQQAIARKSELFPPGTRPLAGWGKERKETLQERQLGKTSLTDTMIVRYSQTKN